MKKITIIFITLLLTFSLAGCGDASTKDLAKTREAGNILQEKQSTPTDINFSLERYNLIRRAYWVNGQREKANAVICEVEKPLSYVALMTESGAVIGRFIVDGKITSLNSYLTPDSMYIDSGRYMPDIDGTYGENDAGIFFFTPDGQYWEWNSVYLYSDTPFDIENPIIRIEGQ